MVSEIEIEHVAKLMKIEITNHKEYVEKVQKMLDFFEILDSAGVEDEEISPHEISLNSLRNDEHIEYDEKLINRLKNYKENYIRAPKMV